MPFNSFESRMVLSTEQVLKKWWLVVTVTDESQRVAESLYEAPSSVTTNMPDPYVGLGGNGP